MNKKYILLLGSVILLILTLGGLAVFSYAVFFTHAEGSIVRSVARALPIPAGRVGSETVFYRDYLQTLDTMRQFANSPVAKAQNFTSPPIEVLRKNLFEHMLYIAAVQDEAAKRKLEVSEEELRAYFADVISAASSTTPDVALYLYQNYGWNEEDFRQKVLRPALFEDRLSVELSKAGGEALEVYMEQRLKAEDVKRYLRF